jgi:hypothetical protein
MSFTATARPATTGGRGHKFTDAELKAAGEIIRGGQAARSDAIKGRRNAQSQAHAARHALAAAMGVDPDTFKSKTVVDDEKADTYRCLVFSVDQAPKAPGRK